MKSYKKERLFKKLDGLAERNALRAKKRRKKEASRKESSKIRVRENRAFMKEMGVKKPR
jgi:hypothetical protein